VTSKLEVLARVVVLDGRAVVRVLDTSAAPLCGDGAASQRERRVMRKTRKKSAPRPLGGLGSSFAGS
jgi:hypothetical protein